MFFNGSNYWKMGMQAFNFAAFSLAIFDQMTNPKAKLSENGLDMFVHAMSFLSLHENASFLRRLVTSGSNMIRLGAIYAAVTSDCSDSSTTPVGILFLDALGHLITAGTLIFAPDEEAENRARRSVTAMTAKTLISAPDGEAENEVQLKRNNH
jgi:hypothetical protein